VNDHDVDVALIGAGATGLYLAALFARDGLRVRLLERRAEPTRHSRAIGIHPPGLEALDEVGAAAPLLERGVRVTRGHATAGDQQRGVHHLGTLDFAATLEGTHRFVLTVPQSDTEAVLEARLAALAPGALRRGVRVTHWQEDAEGVTLHDDAGGSLRTPLLVACTGANGASHESLGGRVAGGPYPDTYVMADLPQSAERFPPGTAGMPGPEEALIHLAPHGVVEAFPLPGGIRRWVVKTPHLLDDAGPEHLAELAFERLGVTLDATAVTMTSAFGVQHRRARPLARGRTWLAGDAAHVVAPIGGQGMTLAWLGARTLRDAWGTHLEGRTSTEEAARSYDTRQHPRARRAELRGAVNMQLGRATRLHPLRSGLVRLALHDPFAGRLARIFTMQEGRA